MDEGARYTGWTMGELPEIMEIERGGRTLVGYPALVDAGDAVDAAGFRIAGEGARGASRRACGGCCRSPSATASATWSAPSARTSRSAPLKDDIVRAALDRTFLGRIAADDAGGFRRGALDEGPQPLHADRAGDRALRSTDPRRARGAGRRSWTAWKRRFRARQREMRAQLERLLAPGWLARTPWERLQHLPRYLKAAALRLDKLRADPQRDQRARGRDRGARAALPARARPAASQRRRRPPSSSSSAGCWRSCACRSSRRSCARRCRSR